MSQIRKFCNLQYFAQSTGKLCCFKSVRGNQGLCYRLQNVVSVSFRSLNPELNQDFVCNLQNISQTIGKLYFSKNVRSNPGFHCRLQNFLSVSFRSLSLFRTFLQLAIFSQTTGNLCCSKSVRPNQGMCCRLQNFLSVVFRSSNLESNQDSFATYKRKFSIYRKNVLFQERKAKSRFLLQVAKFPVRVLSGL